MKDFPPVLPAAGAVRRGLRAADAAGSRPIRRAVFRAALWRWSMSSAPASSMAAPARSRHPCLACGGSDAARGVLRAWSDRPGKPRRCVLWRSRGWAASRPPQAI